MTDDLSSFLPLRRHKVRKHDWEVCCSPSGADTVWLEGQQSEPLSDWMRQALSVAMAFTSINNSLEN